MPSIDDLVQSLDAREAFAPDRETVLRLAATHPSRSRAVTPVLAAAAVVGVASTAFVVAQHVAPDREGPGGGIPSASSTPFTGSAPPATTAPPHPSAALTWAFSVRPIKGYQVTRLSFDPSGQGARIDHGSAFAGFVTMYSYGVEPKALQRAGNATRITMEGRTGYFLAGTSPDTPDPADHPDSWPRLLWQYADNAWAAVEGPFGFDPATRGYDEGAARASELEFAHAVRFGPDAAITEPFAVGALPSSLRVEATESRLEGTPSGAQDCIGYGTGEAYTATDPIGTVLTACRVPAADAAHIGSTADRIVRRVLGDGTTLVLILDKDHLDVLSESQLQSIADHADVSPAVDDRATWLPVGD